ncbi:hypothetical protein PCASD_03026 [Puccinia coronata f. sp. avenae]|uniref:Uncharacterized protein n=1 Tax=Puccinia coronata f. sp. avenae TaxID=200324 RepID=A0A2N5S5W0_9BASI|nr:hypothetical protein PCASD_23711 [Puccinia coronata f. sp. avenae]PLW49170.1 hypothetical protein PCASD_03026 [Puccinia coronata f. sp. avenae]
MVHSSHHPIPLPRVHPRRDTSASWLSGVLSRGIPAPRGQHLAHETIQLNEDTVVEHQDVEQELTSKRTRWAAILAQFSEVQQSAERGADALEGSKERFKK